MFPCCCNLQPGHCINSLNAELNPICHLLALLGAHHILHVSRIRVKVATVGQQQRTDRLDISNTVASAGGFMVVAAATADVLFCSGF